MSKLHEPRSFRSADGLYVNKKRQKNRETNLIGVTLNPSGPYVWWTLLYLIKLSNLDLMIDQITLLFFPFNCFLKQLHKLDVAYRLALVALMLLGPCWLYIWGDIRHGE